MRDLVKGSWSQWAVDAESSEAPATKRRSRHRLRWFVAVTFLLLLGLSGFRLLSAIRPSPPGVSIEYDQTGFSGTLAHAIWRVRVAAEQVHASAQAICPRASVMVILKMAACVVAAAVFLRGPRRT